MKPEDREDLLAALKKIAEPEANQLEAARAAMEKLREFIPLVGAECDEFSNAGYDAEEAFAELERALGTPNVTSAGTDSDDQQNPGTKPEAGKWWDFLREEDGPQD